MTRQATNSLLYLAPAVVGSAVALLTLPILTRILSKEQFGLWGLASAYGSIVSGIANFGMIIGFERNFFEARTPRERGELLYSVIAFVAVMFALCGLATWVGREWIAEKMMRSAVYGELLVLTFAAIGVSSFKLYFLSYYKNTHDARSYVRYSVDETVLGALLSLALVAGFRVGVVGLALGPLIASSIVLFLLAWRFMAEVPIGFSGRALRSALRISLPLAPRVLLSGFGAQFDKYILGLLGTLGGVGIYTVGQRVAGLVGTAMSALQNVYLPQVYERMVELEPAEGRQVIGRYLTPYAYGSVACALLVALFADEALLLLAPRQYKGAGLVASILALAQGISFFGRQPQLQFARRMGLIGALSIVSLGWTMLFMAIGSELIGAPGTALGSFAATLLTAGVSLRFAQSFNPISYEWRELLAIFAPLGAAPLLSALHFAGLLSYPLILLMKLVLLALFIRIGQQLSYLTAHQMRRAFQAFPSGRQTG